MDSRLTFTVTGDDMSDVWQKAYDKALSLSGGAEFEIVSIYADEGRDITFVSNSFLYVSATVEVKYTYG